MVQNDVQKVVQKNNCQAYTRKKLNDIIDLSIKCIVLRVLRSTVQRLAVFFICCTCCHLRSVLFGDGIIALTNQKEAFTLEIDVYSDIMNLSFKVWLFWNVSV